MQKNENKCMVRMKNMKHMSQLELIFANINSGQVSVIIFVYSIPNLESRWEP